MVIYQIHAVIRCRSGIRLGSGATRTFVFLNLRVGPDVQWVPKFVIFHNSSDSALRTVPKTPVHRSTVQHRPMHHRPAAEPNSLYTYYIELNTVKLQPLNRPNCVIFEIWSYQVNVLIKPILRKELCSVVWLHHTVCVHISCGEMGSLKYRVHITICGCVMEFQIITAWFGQNHKIFSECYFTDLTH